MEYRVEHLKMALEQCGALTLVRNAVDIAVIEYDGNDCRCSVVLAEMLGDLGIGVDIVKKVIIHGKNRIKVRLRNSHIEKLFPNAEINYTGLYKFDRFFYGPIQYMLSLHFFPEMETTLTSSRRTALLKHFETATEKSRFLYKIIVYRFEMKNNKTNPFSISVNTDLLLQKLPPPAIEEELPVFCSERRASYKKLIDKKYYEAALDQCFNEIRNGCEKCPVASNYGPKQECPYFQLQLSEFYREGKFVPRNEAIAFNLIKKAAIQGFQEAEFIYARRLSRGNGCKFDVEKAYELYSKLAMRGHVESAYDLAYLYNDDSPLAYRRIPWMIRLANNGDHEIQNILIEQVYSQGAMGIQPDDTLLSKWVEIAAETGNVGCVENLVSQYEKSSNWDNALKWACKLQELRPEENYYLHINELFVKTLEGKDAEYVLKRADDYYDGVDTEINYNNAFLCYSSIAEESVEAMFGKARCYEFGRGIKKDMKQAKELYLRSAENGSVRALKHMYHEFKDFSDENPWKDKFINALNTGVEQNNIYAILIKAKLLIYPKEVIFPVDEEEAYQLYNRAMEMGSIEAIREVGVCFCKGYGVDVDYDRAQELFKKAADHGLASAMRCLGCLFQKGCGRIKKDEKAAYQWYLQAANKEDPHSQYVLGKHFEGRDIAKSNEWYMKAAENGDSKAQDKMIEKLYYGKEVGKDLVLARKWGEEAAAEGQKGVYFRVAYMCCLGIGGPKDYQKAVKYYTILAEDNNAAAINNLAWMTEHGKGVEKDYGKACAMYLKAATLGDGVAMRNIAMKYKSGIGIEKDYSKYLEWMSTGAESGNIQCMYDLAMLYKNGDSSNDVEVDIDKAVRYFEDIVAKQTTDGDIKYHQNALMTVANMYYYGDGVEIDNEKALSLHRKAAESGVVKAYYMLGEHYYHGYGTDEDERMAIFWYRKAAENNYEDAKDKLNELGVDYLTDDDDEEIGVPVDELLF